MALNPKQQRFIEEYFKDFNATAAYYRAGYKAKKDVTAATCASEILRNPQVSRAIEEEMAKVSARTGINAERILREYGRLAFANLRDLIDWGPSGITLKRSDSLSEDDAASVAEISETEFKGKRTLTIKLHGKQAALDALAKHMGLMEQKDEDEDISSVVDEFDKALDATADEVWVEDPDGEAPTPATQ
jgi:phage terminase small subunit